MKNEKTLAGVGINMVERYELDLDKFKVGQVIDVVIRNSRQYRQGAIESVSEHIMFVILDNKEVLHITPLQLVEGEIQITFITDVVGELGGVEFLESDIESLIQNTTDRIQEALESGMTHDSHMHRIQDLKSIKSKLLSVLG